MNNRIFKEFFRVVVIASVAYVCGALPAGAYAQTGQPVTREQVRAELMQLEAAGYNPAVKDNYYPEKIQAAEARVAQQGGGAQAAYGPATASTSQSGSVHTQAGAKSLYFGH